LRRSTRRAIFEMICAGQSAVSSCLGGSFSMLLLARALLIPAALLLLSTAGVAKEIKGTPEALIGTYGTSVQQCKDSKEEYAFDTPYYRTCQNPGCLKRIVSHTATPTGYRLKIRDDGNFKEWSERVTVIDSNTIKWTVAKSVTLHRCSAPAPPPPYFSNPNKKRWLYRIHSQRPEHLYKENSFTDSGEIE
jgi:hypothetical protein